MTRDNLTLRQAAGTPAFLKGMPTEQVKTLKCQECGTMNYPTEWWHWSYGDRYWALLTGAPAALYGPVDERAAEPAVRA